MLNAPVFLALTSRYLALVVSIAATLATGLWLMLAPHLALYLAPVLALFGFLAAVGVHDLIQTRHAVLRNYPITGHLRFMLEDIRPEMRQYFFEADKDGSPFPRDKRAIVYQRAKGELDKRPFGTMLDVYETQYEWLQHSMRSLPPSTEPFRVVIGGTDCTQPYAASVFNISAMSFGSLSPNAMLALNKGAKLGGFAHDTGEGGFSPYHRRARRRHHLGDRLGLLRLPRRQRRFLARALRQGRSQSADQDGRVEAQPGRQARTWRRAAGSQDHARDFAPFAVCRWASTAFRRPITRRSRRRSR